MSFRGVQSDGMALQGDQKGPWNQMERFEVTVKGPEKKVTLK